jgi:hypothetical protein
MTILSSDLSVAITSGLFLLKAHPAQGHTNEEAPTDERSGLGLPNHLVPLCVWDSGVNGSVLGKA